MRLEKDRRLAEPELKAYAVKLLAGRSMSVGEVRDKLRRKAREAGDVDTVIASLKEYGMLDDSKYAEHFAAVRRDSRGVGQQRALSDLLKKRVASPVAQRAVKEAYAEADEVQLIEAYLARKFRHGDLKTRLKEPKELAAVYRRLRGAGFSPGNAIRVLKRFAAEAEQLEGLEDADRDS